MPANYFSYLQKRAYYISVASHPLLMPVLGFIVFNNYNSTSFQGHPFLILLSVYAVSVLALPAYFVFALKRSGYIQSFEMETLEERKLPLLFTSGTMLFNYYLMNRAHLPEIYQLYFLCTSVTAVLTLGISTFYKISLHTIGIGFMFGLGLVLSYLSVSDMRGYLIVTALIAGIIACCRVILMAHTLPQVYWGFMLGLICSSAMLFFI
jgi:hypothetical protein